MSDAVTELESPFWLGEYVDHLYEQCPVRRRQGGVRGQGTVDPEGTDICGWCYRLWKARQS